MLKLKREIAQARKNIRKKYLDLKRGAVDYQIEAEKKLRPLVDPLKKLVQTEVKVEPKKEPDPSFEEPRFMDDWGSFKVTPAQTPAMIRHRAPAPLYQSSTPVTTPRIPSDYRVTDYEYNPAVEHPLAEETFRELFWDMGPLAQQYLRAIITKPNVQDTTYGVKHVPAGGSDRGSFMLGNMEVEFDQNDDIWIGNRSFKGTNGLYALLFLKVPPAHTVTEADLVEYKTICELTNLHKVHNLPEGRILSGDWPKYTRFIQKIFPPKNPNKSRKGKGLLVRNNNKRYNYIYYDQVSEIVERLQLLHAAREAGNTSLDPEIYSIESELRQRNIIV